MAPSPARRVVQICVRRLVAPRLGAQVERQQRDRRAHRLSAASDAPNPITGGEHAVPEELQACQAGTLKCFPLRRANMSNNKQLPELARRQNECQHEQHTIGPACQPQPRHLHLTAGSCSILAAGRGGLLPASAPWAAPGWPALCAPSARIPIARARHAQGTSCPASYPSLPGYGGVCGSQAYGL